MSAIASTPIDAEAKNAPPSPLSSHWISMSANLLRHSAVLDH